VHCSGSVHGASIVQFQQFRPAVLRFSFVLYYCAAISTKTKEMLAKEEENACLGLGTLVLQFAKASVKVLHQRLGAILLPLGYIATP
jgi:hypothetical protein